MRLSKQCNEEKVDTLGLKASLLGGDGSKLTIGKVEHWQILLRLKSLRQVHPILQVVPKSVAGYADVVGQYAVRECRAGQ